LTSTRSRDEEVHIKGRNSDYVIASPNNSTYTYKVPASMSHISFSGDQNTSMH
jgi:hypothetical protein